MLRFANRKEPSTARAWSCEIHVKVARVEAGQVGREVKGGMFLGFTYQTHSVRKMWT